MTRDTDRRRKLAAMLLLAAMVVVAAVLWQWPSAVRPSQHWSVRADVVLPALPDVRPAPAPSVVSAPASKARVEHPRPVLASTAAAPDPPLWSRHPRLPMLRPAPVAAGGVVVPKAAAVSRAAVDSRALPIMMQPAVAAPAGASAAQANSANPAHALARAGVALGGAFRKAGVNTAAAFTRIF